jgi:hypothetical protein
LACTSYQSAMWRRENLILSAEKPDFTCQTQADEISSQHSYFLPRGETHGRLSYCCYMDRQRSARLWDWVAWRSRALAEGLAHEGVGTS